MNDLMRLNQDCRHMRWDRPCFYHKKEGVLCPGCPHYEPVKRRLLVVKLAADGDVLRTTGILPRLHEEVSGTHVTWLTAPSAAPLLAGNPLVDRVLVAAGTTPPELLVERFSQVICPDADPPSCALAALAGTGKRRGFTLSEYGVVRPISTGAREWLQMGLDDRAKRAGTRTYQEVMQRVLGLAAPAGPPQLHLSEGERERAREFRRRAEIPSDRPLVGFNTGAGSRWPQKKWRYGYFLELGRRLVARGRAVLLLGGPDERERNERLLAEGGEGFHDAGWDNPVRDFAARLGLCDLVVTGDTLALHLGTALERPVVALFGPTSSAEIDLFGRGEKILPRGMECLCCYDPHCRREPNCQDAIPVDRVEAAVEKWLP